MFKKAFTLIELLGVLILLAIIALITIPIIDKSLESSRQAAYDRAVDNIVNAAQKYSVSNDLGYSTTRLPLFVSELQDEGFLTLDIKSPIDESEMNGCVWYYWDEDHKQYIFEYDNVCTIEDPSIDITYNAGLINSNGWAKENIATTLVGTGEIKYCISNSECEPTEAIVNGSNTKFITNEGTSYICASSTNILGESTSICKNFKLDKTAPTIDGLESITVDKDESVDLTSGVKVDDNLSGIDGTYTMTPNTVDTSTAGTKNVIYSVSDLAGNVTTENRTIRVESEPPVIVFNVEGNPFNSNNWSKENVTVRIDVTDNSGLGIKEIRYCKGTGECEPTTTIENGGTVVLEDNSATNKICVEAIDNNNTSSRLCSNNYQIDKVLPTIDSIGDIKVNRNEVVNLTSGVTYNDGLSGIDGELTITPSTVDTSTIGTKQVTYRVVDKAGNIREVVRNVIVDADAPTIVFNLVDSSAINSNGWAKSDFYLRATIIDNSGTGIASGSSCTTNSSSECTPVASFTGTTKDFLISVEGSNRACVQVTDNNNKTTKVCSNTYNLDKTAPTAGTATFSGTLGSNSWYTTNVTVNKVNGSDALSGHYSTTSNISSITSNTTGTMITITTTDLAGNSSSRNYTIKVDKNAPILTAKSSNVTITVGDSYPVANLYTLSYSTSGGSVVCKNGSTTITNLNSLSNGTHTITCTATGGNGKTSSINISVKVESEKDLYWAYGRNIVRVSATKTNQESAETVYYYPYTTSNTESFPGSATHFVINDGYIYWAYGRNIVRVSATKTNQESAETVYYYPYTTSNTESFPGSATHFVINDGYIYWAYGRNIVRVSATKTNQESAETVYYYPYTTSNTESFPGSATHFVINDGYIYWAYGRNIVRVSATKTNQESAETVYYYPYTTSNTESFPGSATHFVINDGYIYWAYGRNIVRVSATKTNQESAETVYYYPYTTSNTESFPGSATHFVINDGYIYWAYGRNIVRVSATKTNQESAETVYYYPYTTSNTESFPGSAVHFTTN